MRLKFLFAVVLGLGALTLWWTERKAESPPREPPVAGHISSASSSLPGLAASWPERAAPVTVSSSSLAEEETAFSSSPETPSLARERMSSSSLRDEAEWDTPSDHLDERLSKRRQDRSGLSSSASASSPLTFGNLSGAAIGSRHCRSGFSDWFVDGDFPGDPLRDYTYGVEPQGAGSAYLKSTKARPSTHAQLNHCWDPKKVRSKRVRLSAQLKFRAVEGYANLHLRARDVNERFILDERRPIRGSSDWKLMSLEAQVPEASESFHFGITLEGAGEIQIKEVRFEIL